MSKHDYAAGQVWAYETRPGDEGSLLKIQAVEEFGGGDPAGDGKVYHVSVVGFRFANPAVPPQLSHVPVGRETLDASVTERVANPEFDFPEADEGIAAWKQNQGGVFTLPVAGIVQMFDDMSRDMSRMSTRYFRVDWDNPDEQLPAWMIFEVEQDGRVPRTIHVFKDGGIAATDVEEMIAEGVEPPGDNSLVEGDFFEIWAEVELGVPNGEEGDSVLMNEIDPDDFDEIWDAVMDAEREIDPDLN